MLRRDVVDAVREGRFQVYAVADVDAAMVILSGLSPGRVGATGEFPPKSINGRVQQCLANFARLRMAFAGPALTENPGDKKGAS